MPLLLVYDWQLISPAGGERKIKVSLTWLRPYDMGLVVQNHGTPQGDHDFVFVNY